MDDIMETSNMDVSTAVEGGEVPTTSSPQSEPPTPSLEDMAAHDYKRLIPEFFKILDNLPKKRAARLMRALIEYPLENDKPHLPYADEAKAFYIGMQILDCKFVIWKAVVELAKDRDAMKEFQKEVEQLKEGKTE